MTHARNVVTVTNTQQCSIVLQGNHIDSIAVPSIYETNPMTHDESNESNDKILCRNSQAKIKPPAHNGITI